MLMKVDSSSALGDGYLRRGLDVASAERADNAVREASQWLELGVNPGFGRDGP